MQQVDSSVQGAQGASPALEKEAAVSSLLVVRTGEAFREVDLTEVATLGLTGLPGTMPGLTGLPGARRGRMGLPCVIAMI